MRSSNVFWGGVFIIVGGLFLMDSLGIININLWQVIWPLLLILLGVWVLMGYLSQGKPIESQESVIPLDDSKSAMIHVHHGAGRLSIGSGAGVKEMVSGSFGGGMKYKAQIVDGLRKVTLRVRDWGFPVVVFPWIWGNQNALDWDLRLTDEIPIKLRINTGASDSRLDLTDLQVTDLRIDTGASATEIRFPDSVDYTKAVIKAGAASVTLKIPDNVAAKIRVTGGLMDAKIDRERFPKSGSYYQSLAYESAVNKAEIRIDIGVGSVSVK